MAEKKRFHDSNLEGKGGGRQYLSGKSNGMLVHYAPNKFSNLPTDPVMQEWPKASYYAGWDLDDTITGINDQIGTDGAKMKKNSARAGYKY